MRVMGIDQSLSRTGISIWDGKTVVLDKYSSPKRLSWVERSRLVRNYVRKIVNKHSPDVVAIEVPVVGESSSEMLHGLYALIMDALLSKSIPVVAINNQTLKSLVGPKGQKGKSGMVSEAKRLLGSKVKIVHDQADAFFLSHFTRRFWVAWKELEEVQLSPRETAAFFSQETNSKGVCKGILYRRGEFLFLPKKGS